MKISYNPKSSLTAITTETAANDDIIFDLYASKLWAKGVRIGADWADISSKPSSLKNPYALTISLNGTSQGPYDGSAAKSINITPSSIGAATSDHIHPYLPLSGGTVTGNIILKGETSADMTYAGNVHPYIRFDNSDSDQNVSLIFTDNDAYRHPAGIKLVGNQGNEWFEAANIYATTFYGALSGNATTATTLQTARTIWGQLFDGTGNVSGFMRNVSGLIYQGILNEDWSDGNNTHPWYGIDYRHCVDSAEPGKAYTSISSYFGLYFKTGGSRFIFDGGNVGIGTTSPAYKLDVIGDTKITGSIRDLAIGGGIYWDPHVESASDNSNAASITVVRAGVAGGTTLVLSLMNDANDTILFKTSDAARLYHNNNFILTSKDTKVTSGKGYIDNTEITLVNNSINADMIDNVHLESILTFKNSIGNQTQNNHDFHSVLKLGVYAMDWGGYIANHPSDWEDGSNHYGLMLHFGNIYNNHSYILLDKATDNMYFKNITSATSYGLWYKVAHSGNSSISGSTITINGNSLKLNIANWDTAYNLRHSHANKSVLDGITSGLVTNWNIAYTFVNTITREDADKVINKWDEIVNFLAGITEDNKLNTLLNSKLSILLLSSKDILTTKTNNALFWVNTIGTAGSITTGPFTDHPYALLSVTNFSQNDTNGKFFYRSRLAFSSAGDIKVASCHHVNEYKLDEAWYNVLTSKNSGIDGSTIKLNGTSITVYSSSTADGRYVKKSGDTMTGALNFANNIWNNVGDDVAIGDHNIAGCLGIKGLNAGPGLAFCNSSNTLLGKLVGTANLFLRISGNNTYNILDTSTTLVSDGKGIINGTTITQVDNATNSTNSTNARKLVNWYSARPTSLNAQFGDGSLRIFYATSSTTEGKCPTDATVLHLAWDNNHGWDSQLAINSPSSRVYLRSQNNGTWQPWKTLAFTTDIPTSLKNPHALTLKANGTVLATYDGSSAKEANFTYTNVGAASANHNHDTNYVRRWDGVYGIANKFLKLTISDEKGWIRLEVSDSNNGLTGGYGIYMIGWGWHGDNNTDNLNVSCLYANNVDYVQALKVVKTSRNNYDIYFQFKNPAALPAYTVNYCKLSVQSLDYTVTAVSEIPTATWTSSLSALQLNASQVNWSGITNKPSEFNPAAHTHTVFKNNLMIKGTNGISDSASIHLGIGDSDTGFKWISDGKCLIYANNVAVGEWTSGGMNWFKNPTVNGNKVWNAGNDGPDSGLDADTVDGYHATSGRTFNGNINWSENWNDAWSDGTHTHPWYGFDHRYSRTGVYSTTLSDYFGLTLKTGSGNISMTNNGNVGIGLFDPIYKLLVAGNVYASDKITSAGFKHSGVTENSDLYVLTADGGYTFLNLTSNELAHEFDVDITVTSEWLDIEDFYGDNLNFLTLPGTYIVLVYYTTNSANSMYEGYFSGIMSWYTGTTNSNNADEIVLHRVGHAYANTIYLRTRESLRDDPHPYTKLQISANSDLKQHTYKFKFKRIC